MRVKVRTSILGAALVVSAAYLTFAELETKTKQPPKRPAAATGKKTVTSGAALIQTRRNIGKAYYEQGKYPEATGEFQKVIASAQALASDHLNMGLALMQANKLDEALGELTTSRQMDPKLLAADYNLGILFKRELRYPDAEAALKRVTEADPNDPAAWFNLGTVYFAQKKLEQAMDAHRQVVNMGLGRGQNFYVASLFHSFTILIRLNQKAEAERILKVHEKMRDKVPGISLQNPALEGGKYGAILVPQTVATAVARRTASETVRFADFTAKSGITLPATGGGIRPGGPLEIKANEYSLQFARRNLVPLFGSSVAIADYDGDGRPDLYLVNPAGTNHLFHNNGDGTFTDVTDKAGVAGPGASVSAAFADYDNSSHPSLFVVGAGGVRLFRNQGDGTFKDETVKAGLKIQPGELDTRAVLFDADDDGFLDLVVTAYTDLNAPPQKESFIFPDDFPGATTHFYRNNGDGTFTDATATAGFASAQGRAREALVADFDNDGYADLLLLRDDAPPVLYLNQGEGRFVDRTAEAGPALRKSVVFEGQVADFNHDGNFDLCLWTRTGYQVLLNRGGARFEAASGLPSVPPRAGPFAFRGTVADLNGDSFADLLASDATGKLRLLANRAGRLEEAGFTLPMNADDPFTSMAPAWLAGPGKLDLVAATESGRMAVFEKEGPSARWVEVRLSGFKSNKQGIGAIVEFKAGNFYNKVVATGEPVRIFVGDLAKLDVVRVTWPNQVIQNSVDVATNKPIEVRESERLASSCPLLYVWTGERYAFLTDVLGVAPLGELSPDGTRIKPYPEEFVRLPAHLPGQNGFYVFQLTDELREVDYVDHVRLVAVDHPVSEEVYSNEIYTSRPTPPALYAVRQKRFPVSAVDDHGHDVLPLLQEVDGRYPTDFRRHRILGLADLHTLTLDPGEIAPSDHLAMWLTGWVFWTDSNAARALISNHELRMVPPYLQVRNEQGEWVTVVQDLGLPSGTNRTMRVDLTGKFLSADHHVRIVTNFCVYWDHIFFSIDDAPAMNGGVGLKPDFRSPVTALGERSPRRLIDRRNHSVIELPLVSADLHYRGFSTVASDPGHLKPDSFDYVNLLAEAPWNPMRGQYTRYGTVDRLLRQADDRMVVMATGDELTVKFDSRGLPPVRPGWRRDLFLYTYGWAKDGEPNTAFSRSVAPLPFRTMSNYPPGERERYPVSDEHKRYFREYQTRPGHLLMPPLAPAQ